MKNEDKLSVKVKDNGIGLKAAEEIKKNSILSSISLSSDILNQRLRLTKMQDEYVVNLKIKDLYPDDTNGEYGTLAELIIQLPN